MEFLRDITINDNPDKVFHNYHGKEKFVGVLLNRKTSD